MLNYAATLIRLSITIKISSVSTRFYWLSSCLATLRFGCFLRPLDSAKKYDRLSSSPSFLINTYQHQPQKHLRPQADLSLILGYNRINELMRGFSADESSDFSKYFPAEDRSSLYNYSTSYNNETLLLETTDIQKNRPAALNILEQHQQERSRSLLQDLYEQLQATVSHGELQRQGEGRLDGPELYDVCKQLMGTLRRLESKVERMDDSKKGWDSHKDVESVSTYSSMQASKGSKGCRCETQKTGLTNLLEYVEYRSKLDLYREENEQLKRQVIQLQIGNEETRKHLRRLECENMRIKQLLKQYQLSTKQKNINFLNSDRRPLLRNPHLLEQPVLRHQMRSDGKQNIKQLLECRIREEEARQSKQTPMTPNPLLRIIKNNNQKTESKQLGSMGSRERIEQLSQRVGQLLDLDNQKTNSKSKETNKGKKVQAKSKHSFVFREMLQQSNYEVQAEKQPLPTMSSLPDPCQDLHRAWSAQRFLWPDRSWRMRH